MLLSYCNFCLVCNNFYYKLANCSLYWINMIFYHLMSRLLNKHLFFEFNLFYHLMSRLLNKHLFFEKTFPTEHTVQMAGTLIQAKKIASYPGGKLSREHCQVR